MLNPLQLKLLEMLKWFHQFCVENGITYYAVGGTMIGAARHNGFIPWDDDIDIGLPRKDYKHLIKLFTKRIEHYILESPYTGNKDYLFTYCKLYDINTTLVESLQHECRRGIYIDIFPVDGIGNTKQEALQNFRLFDKKNMFLMTRTCSIRKERSWYKNASIIISHMIPNFLVNNKQLAVDLDALADKINKDDAVYVANLNGSYREREITLRENFGVPTSYKFEDIYIYGPEKYDEYLSDIYGNWRKLPPENKRKTSHDFKYLNLEKSYFDV